MRACKRTPPEKSSHLVLAHLLRIRAVNTDLLVILLESREVLASLRELSLLHTLADVPVHESTLRVQEVELVVKTAPRRRDGGRVGKHAHRARHLGKVTARDVRRSLVADTDLEAGRAPVDKLDRALGLDRADSCVDILRNNVAAVEKRASHVLALTRVALDHLVASLEAREGHVRHRVLLVVRLLRRDDRRKGGKREVNARERHQVGLELVQVDVE